MVEFRVFQRDWVQKNSVYEMPKHKLFSPKQLFRFFKAQWKDIKKPWGFIELFALAYGVIWLLSATISSWKWLTTQLDLDEVYFAGKSAWEWAELLVVPLLLLLFSIAVQQALKGRDIQRTRQEVLKSYLNQMTELLLNPDWPKADDQAKSTITAVAHAKTLAVLRELDGEQKGALIRFLIESEAFPFISLCNADLENANLIGVNLEEAYLPNVRLDFAYLNGARLRGAKLMRAKFLGTDFKPAKLSINYEFRSTFLRDDFQDIVQITDLSSADLSDANLRSSNLEAACLEEAILFNANLQNVNLSSGILCNANLQYASLIGADLTNANLEGANLENADLEEANLTETNFKDTDLSKVRNWTNSQLRVAKLCNTKLPEGCTILQPKSKNPEEL